MDDAKNQAISDDQELAKVLQGMQQQTRSMATSDPAAKDNKPADAGLQYEEVPAPGAKTGAKPAEPVAAPAASAPAEPALPPLPSTPPPAASPTDAPVAAAPAVANPALESLKKEALEELRPLVSKLDLPAKEKFDTLLLIIRSTDDQSLLEPAHAAAKSIEDETERAEALLDIVKEIDYFASQK